MKRDQHLFMNLKIKNVKNLNLNYDQASKTGIYNKQTSRTSKNQDYNPIGMAPMTAPSNEWEQNFPPRSKGARKNIVNQFISNNSVDMKALSLKNRN